MKNQFLFLFLLLSNFLFSQVVIRGTVYEEKGALEGVAIYLNNTMIGTTTDANGEFSLNVKEGQYELIVSYLGFKKINYSLNTSTYKKPLIFDLKEQANVLDEIVIKKIVYDDNWKYNLSLFKLEFIGKTELAKDCEILNPKVLFFDYNAKENILTAFARKPLQIKHKSLGYLITYELENFTRNSRSVTYLGYTRYQELKGGKRKQKRWKKNRLKAYNGSTMHFLKSVSNNTFKKEGFIVNQFKRVLNPKRPSDNEIKKARELIKLNRSLTHNLNTNYDNPKTALDSAFITVKKARLPKSIDYLYKSKLKQKDIYTLKNGVSFLSFDNNLSVVYTKEMEEIAYITRNAFSKKRDPLPQTSSIIPFKKEIEIDKSGNLINPLDLFFEGYWSFEKFGNALPLDYEPRK